MSLFKKNEPVKKTNKFEELMKSSQKPKDALIIEVKNGIIKISGRSYMEDDRQQWIEFLDILRTDLVARLKSIVIDINVNMFNTSQGQYPTVMMKILSDNNHKCKAKIIWNYGEDEKIYGHGLFLKKSYTNVDFELVGADNIEAD